MLVGYVSDENYVALSGVELVFENEGGLIEVRSCATGAVVADIQPGTYCVTLAKPGFGSKRVNMSVADNEPYQFRLLSDRMYGFMWPKWVKAGEKRATSTPRWMVMIRSFAHGCSRRMWAAVKSELAMTLSPRAITEL